MAPSPKYATATPRVVRDSASAAPVAAAMLPPTIPNEPISPSAGDVTFIDPARPPFTPVARPSISSSSACGSTPSAVAIFEQARDAGRDRLLSRVQMRRAVHLALQEQRLDELLEAADQVHLPVNARVQLEVAEHARSRAGHVGCSAEIRPARYSQSRSNRYECRAGGPGAEVSSQRTRAPCTS